MRIATVLVAVAVAGGLSSLAVWVARRGEVPVSRSAPAPSVAEETGPVVSPTGPWPKAELDQSDLSFGVMEVGEERKLTFKVTNHGEAPLVLAKGETTCQCTLSDVASKPIPPGGSGEILITWKPTEVTPMFEKGATIRTNDPKNRELKITIRGRIVQRLLTSPSQPTWEIPEVSDTEPATFVGKVYSHTESDLKILGLDSDSPNMTAEATALTPGELKEFHAASGAAITIKVQPDKTSGGFAYPLTIRTNLKERLPDGTLGEKDLSLKVTVKGSRKGAIRFFGAGYDPLDAGISLRSFQAREGRSHEIRAIISRAPEEGLKVLSVKADPEILKVEMTPIGKARPGKPQNYSLKLTYPENGPLMMLNDEKPGHVTITTNHPEVPEIHLNVYLHAY